jgi:hypothetical protein
MLMYATLQRAHVTPEFDIVVDVKHDSYYAGVTRPGFLPMPNYTSQPFSSEEQARTEANKWFLQILSGGLDAITKGVSLHRPDALLAMHPRQAAVLREVPRRHRRVVTSRAHLLQNLGGGVLSSNLYAAVQEYQSLVAHRGGHRAAVALEQRSRADNHAAMRSCARKGCEACARSTA